MNIPLKVKQDEYECKLIVKDERGKGKKLDSSNIKMIVSVKTLNLGNVDAYIRLQNKNLECEKNGDLSLGFYDYSSLNEKEDWTFEAGIVAIADEIAQRHHDIEDGIYAGVINRDELIEKLDENFGDVFNKGEKKLIKSIDKKSGDSV